MHDIVTITVNYKMKDDIDRMLQSLKEDIKDTQLKVLSVIVDNDSQDGIKLMLQEKHPHVEFVGSPQNVGFGKANNVALRRYPACYYFIVNPDVEFPVQQKTLEAMHKFMEDHPRVGMVGPKLLNNDGTLQYSCYRFPEFLTQPLSRLAFDQKWVAARKRAARLHMKDFDHASTRPVDWVMGSAMFVRGSVLAEVGHFDDRYFMYFEDCDWCRRFWQHGWPVYYLHHIELRHAHHRYSAHVDGRPVGFWAIFSNKLTRIHIKSWLQYFWKWRRDPLRHY